MKIRVNYKSGFFMVFKCEDFTVTRNAVTITYEWSGAKGTMPLDIGADEIESVWRL